jgi:hypothetical protein
MSGEIGTGVNLAPLSRRRELGRRIFEPGKHPYSEQPAATKLEDADDLLNFAASQRFLVPGEAIFSSNARPSHLSTSLDRILGRSMRRAIR